ncbi:MAG TPA: glycosyltransferase family A protein [Pyrinomonadaceae bacterium]
MVRASYMPKVTIIIPTYNRPHLLGRTVESARAAGDDVEIILVDDASVDGTRRVCEELEGVRHIRLERNQGVAGARNVGIVASSAPYIAFLDDDDLRLPGSLDLQVEALAAEPEAGFVCGGMLMAGQDRNPTGEAIMPNHPSGDLFWELLELDFPVMPISVVMRKDCFFRVGLLDRRLGGIDDWDIFVRFAELFPVVVMNEPVSIYRKPTPFSAQGSSARARQLARAARHQLKLLRLPRALSAPRARRREARRRALNRISDVLLRQAATQLPEGAFQSAGANLFAAFRLNPFGAARPEALGKACRKLFSRRDEEGERRARPA